VTEGLVIIDPVEVYRYVGRDPGPPPADPADPQPPAGRRRGWRRP
jgi:hypothetical protein